MGTYLVTGCAGFIGAHLTRDLLADGHTVVGIDVLEGGYARELKARRLRWFDMNSQMTFLPNDLHEVGGALLKDKFGQFDAIYHLAGLAGVRQSLDNPLGYIAQNVLGLQRVLDWAREGIARRVVYASSSSVYSPTHEWPMAVGQDDDLPRTPYAASKRMMELLAHAYHNSYGVESVGLRYFSVYGPAGRPDSRASIFQYVRQIIETEEITIYGDPHQARDFTHVYDAVNMTRLVGESPAYAKRCDVLNAGFGVPRRVLDVIRWISDIVDVHPVVRFVTDPRTDTRHTWAEVEQEFVPLKANQIEFGHGLRQCVDWYQDNRDWAKEIKP